MKMNNKENHDDELPKLNIEQENEFKKIKFSIEHGGSLFGKSNSNLPPEIEGEFLDYISNFEKAYKDVKQIAVFDKIGKPDYTPEANLSDDEITTELERIETILGNHNIGLDVLCDYENEERLIYKFLTEELFLQVIDDMNVSGMNAVFIYEEFHPNHKYDLERDTIDFLKMFLDKDSRFYEKNQSENTQNNQELNNFRSLFQEFQMTFFDLKDITPDEENATVKFDIEFWGKMDNSNSKISYSGEGKMTFENKYRYWYLQKMELPIQN
jgi:hypothetical protein